jgi:hypothetical protein
VRKNRHEPEIADEVPQGEVLTTYDERHLITHLRLLDAERRRARIGRGRIISLVRSGCASTGTGTF